MGQGQAAGDGSGSKWRWNSGLGRFVVDAVHYVHLAARVRGKAKLTSFVGT